MCRCRGVEKGQEKREKREFWRIGLPAPAAASGPAPLDMDPPRAGDRPPPGVGAALCGLRAALPERCVDFKNLLFRILFGALRGKGFDYNGENKVFWQFKSNPLQSVSL